MTSSNPKTRRRQRHACKERAKEQRNEWHRQSNTAWGRMCGNKKTYPMQDDALNAAAQCCGKSRSGYLRVYQCDYCEMWRITSKPQ